MKVAEPANSFKTTETLPAESSSQNFWLKAQNQKLTNRDPESLWSDARAIRKQRVFKTYFSAAESAAYFATAGVGAAVVSFDPSNKE